MLKPKRCGAFGLGGKAAVNAIAIVSKECLALVEVYVAPTTITHTFVAGAGWSRETMAVKLVQNSLRWLLTLAVKRQKDWLQLLQRLSRGKGACM